MSQFDPNSFLESSFTGANSTQRTPCPAGEYVAVIEDINVRQWSSRKDPSKSGLALDVRYSIEHSGVKAQLGRDKVTVTQGIMLDTTPSGSLDMGAGKNVTLGRLREAVGLNDPAKPFSFRQLTGRMAKIQVSHRVDGTDIYDEVKGVIKV